MSDLSPEARRLLTEARSGLGPDPSTIARMQGRVLAQIAAPSAAAAPLAAKASGLAIAKIVAVTAIATTAAAVTVRHYISRPAPRISVAAPAAVPVPAAVPAPVTVPVPAPAAAIPVPPPAPAPHHRIHPPAPPAPAPPAPAPPPPLSRELALLDDATTAASSGDLPAALTQLRLYDRETSGRGQLAEDAAALEVELLCRLHDPTSSAALASFDQRWPHSAERARLVVACKP